VTTDPETQLARLTQENEELRKLLEESEARASAEEQAGNLGLWELDPATGTGSWSAKMFDFYYMDAERDAPALTDGERLIHPEDFPRVMANMGLLMQAQGAPPIVFRTHPDLGPIRYLRAAVSKVDGRAGGVRMFGAVTDVTDQTRVEGELALSRRMLEAVYRHSPYTIFAVQRDRTISFINRVAPGYDAESVMGQRFDAFVAERDKAGVAEQMDRAFEGIEGGRHEIEDGAGTRWQTRYAPVRNDSGEVETVLCFTHDVTEERQRQAQMQHAQKLESLGVLAGGIAHDFNNLLVAILGNAELALMDLSPTSPARECIQEIVTSSRRAAELCRQMLAYSGKGKFLVQAVDPRALVQEMAHLLEVSISKQAVLRYDFSEHTSPIEADVTQLRQVVMNLITNASDAIGGRDGIIRIATGTAHCDQAYLSQAYLRDDLPDGDYTFLEVSDTGSGMDAATRERMFEPFFSSKDDGRGLGLSAVLGIVRSHHGAIRVYSEVGKGTTIKVLLPATKRPAVAIDEGNDGASIWHGEGLILVVDDEPGVRRFAERTLRKAGFDVITAKDGIEAVEMYTKRSSDIAGVLLDMTMPRMDGKTAFAEMRKVDAGVRVVLSSGYNEQDATSEFAGKGLAGFIQKPYRPPELIEAFRALLV
jgi:PAS domain S-box-containing protein